MRVWFYMLLMDLLLPFTMIDFGRYFIKKAPKSINGLFRYRTSRFMKNKDAWEFAHRYCGMIWYIYGVSTFSITVVCMILLIGKGKDIVGIGRAIMMGI